MVMSLYPRTKNKADLAANVVAMLDQAIGTGDTEPPETAAQAPAESTDYLDEKRS
jgi:hypothetical protein